jgi:hypothetical protein
MLFPCHRKPTRLMEDGCISRAAAAWEAGHGRPMDEAKGEIGKGRIAAPAPQRRQVKARHGSAGLTARKAFAESPSADDTYSQRQADDHFGKFSYDVTNL